MVNNVNGITAEKIIELDLAKLGYGDTAAGQVIE